MSGPVILGTCCFCPSTLRYTVSRLKGRPLELEFLAANECNQCMNLIPPRESDSNSGCGSVLNSATATCSKQSGSASGWPSTRESLLLSLRSNDNDKAWTTFVDVYAPLVYGVCQQRGLQDADAADVTQSVLLRVSSRMRNFDYDRDRGLFRSWLGTVTRNEIARLRDRSRLAASFQTQALTPQIISSQAVADDQVWADEFNDHILRTALARVRPEFSSDVWQAFEMLWVQEKSTAEVVAACHRERGWLYKARHLVVQRLEQEVRLLTDDVPFLHL